MSDVTCIKSHYNDRVKYEPNKDIKNRQAKIYWGKAFRSQPYTKNYKQQMNAENEDTSLTQGKTTPTGRKYVQATLFRLS